METLAIRRNRGFTLIEILVVLVIMMIMMGIAVVGFVDWGRGGGMRAAVLNFRNTFSQARGHAITHRERAQLRYGNLPPPPPPGTPPGPPPVGTPPWRGYYYVTTKDGAVIGTTNVLPEGVVISNVNPDVGWPFDESFVEFTLDGSCAKDANGDGSSGDEWWMGNTRRVTFFEGGRRASSTNFLSATLEMYRAQGSIKRIDE